MGPNLPDLNFMDFQRPQGNKIAKSPAPLPANLQISSVRADIFNVSRRTQSGWSFFFQKFQILQAGERKYWGLRKISSFFWILKILQCLSNFISRRYPKKMANSNHLKAFQKHFQPDRTWNGGEKGGKLVFDTQKTSFEKNAK